MVIICERVVNGNRAEVMMIIENATQTFCIFSPVVLLQNDTLILDGDGSEKDLFQNITLYDDVTSLAPRVSLVLLFVAFQCLLKLMSSH